MCQTSGEQADDQKAMCDKILTGYAPTPTTTTETPPKQINNKRMSDDDVFLSYTYKLRHLRQVAYGRYKRGDTI